MSTSGEEMPSNIVELTNIITIQLGIPWGVQVMQRDHCQTCEYSYLLTKHFHIQTGQDLPTIYHGDHLVGNLGV